MSGATLTQRRQQWSDAEVARAKSMWRDGRTTYEIAEALKRPRNSILGKLNRLNKLGKRESTKAQGMMRQRAAVQREQPRIPAADPVGARILASDIWEPIEGVEPISLEARASTQCAWPVTNGFCGAPIERGAFCAHHAAIGYAGKGGSQ